MPLVWNVTNGRTVTNGRNSTNDRNTTNGRNESKVNETSNEGKIFIWLIWFYCIQIYTLYQVQACTRFIILYHQ